MVAAPGYALDLLDPSSTARLRHIDKELNGTTWAASNLRDDDPATRWLSDRRDNDLIYDFDAASSERCFERFTLTNYAGPRSVRQFMLLRSFDPSLATDTGTAGWHPVIAYPSPGGLINHLHWGQGGRLTGIDKELNATTWAAVHLNNGSLGDRWLSDRSNNVLEYAFDTDWDGSQGDTINVSEIRLHNYGGNRSVKVFQIEVTSDGSSWSKLEVPGTAAGQPDFNFSLAQEGGSLEAFSRELNATTWAAANIHDGDTASRWLSDRSTNTLDFVFDPDGDGVTGAAGDLGDRFQMEKFRLVNYGGTRSIKAFQVEVRTTALPSWTKLPVPGSLPGQPDYDFLLAQQGATLTAINRELNAGTWAAANIHDGDSGSRWLSDRSNNTLDFQFDPDFDGTNGAAGDTDDYFAVEKIGLVNYGGNRSVRQFQIEVQTSTVPTWTKLETPGSGAGDPGFDFLLMHESGRLTAVNSELNGTTWAAANLHDGDSGTRWLSNKQDNTIEFRFDTDGDGSDGDAVNFNRIRLYNYGGNRSVATFEVDIEVGGIWSPLPASPGPGTVFSAGNSSVGQEWAVGNQTGVTGIRFRTLSNYGDPYTGARGLELLGTSVGPGHTFVAGNGSAGETWTLDLPDRPTNVTALRFRSISNYGDPYTGARELKVLGTSLGRDYTFTAGNSSAGETFILDVGDRPTDVTHVRLRTISNYGDPYTGAGEFEVLGTSVGPSHSFQAGSAIGPHTFTLDSGDEASNVIGARFRTISNHGDPYTGARQLELLGTPVGPSYIFYAADSAPPQTFSFNATSARLFRFHTFDNHGDPYTGAREIGLESASACGPVGEWRMEEAFWAGAGGEIKDSSGNGFTGSGMRGATTDDADPVVSGDPGTCRYGAFDGVDDYVTIPHDDLLNGSDELTYSIWVYPNTWSGVRQVMAKSVHGGGSGRAQMGIFSESGVLKGRAETNAGRKEISTALTALNTWSHLALVFSGTELRLYVNGAQAASMTFASTTLKITPDPLEIGRRTLSDRYFFQGAMDEARVYKRSLNTAEIGIIMTETHPCGSTAPTAAFAFNCVESGQDALTGRLYTKLVGQSFAVDVVALKDADGNSVADGIETSFADKADVTVTLELVDSSSGGSCVTLPALTPPVSQPIVFQATDQGRKSSAAMMVGQAFRSVGCRVTDVTDPPNPVVGCSTDALAVRPTAITLNSPVLNNTGPTGAPSAPAGQAFALEADSDNGYDGTPTIDTTKLEAHAGAVRVGGFTGVFDSANPATGAATGSNFTYDEVGNFRLQAQGVYDSGFTAVDQAGGDCTPDFSNTVVGGKVGCSFGNLAATDWVGRFTPASFSVALDRDGALANTCLAGSFSYAGEGIGYTPGQEPRVTITALNLFGNLTQNYTDTSCGPAFYCKLTATDVSVGNVTADASNLGADGATLLAVSWAPDTATLLDNGNGTFSYQRGADLFAYARDPNALVAPVTSDIDLTIQSVSDADGIAATGLPFVLSPSGVPVHYGRIGLTNAFGSELNDLTVPTRAESFAGPAVGFVPHTADLCTTGLTITLADADPSDNLQVTLPGSETCVFATAAEAGGYACSPAGPPAQQFSQPPSGGAFNLNLRAPGAGNTGTARVTVDAPSWLEYDWAGTGMTDPSSLATFGIYNGSQPIIYLQEMR